MPEVADGGPDLRYRSSSADCLAGGGEMGALARSIDWSRTAIGPVESWSPALRLIVKVVLANRLQMLIWWGPQFCQLYNDAFWPALGTKHPRAMGQPAAECWPEIWPIIGPLIETPFRGGAATWMNDIFLHINRNGFMEETHWTIAYSPLPDDAAASGIGGVLGTVNEITDKIVGERRLLLLRDLGARSTEAKTAEEACAIAAETIAHHPEDIPFALIYLVAENRERAYLAGTAGVAAGLEASPPEVNLAGTDADPWRVAEAFRSETIQTVEDLSSRLRTVPPGPWPDPPRVAAVCPIPSNIAHQLAGLLVVGVSSHLVFDGSYRGFFELVASQVATTIANAKAYEEERRRAEALAAIDRAKTAFFSNVSHEFRTPLTLMIGPLQDLLARATTQGGSLGANREALDLVYRNGQRVLKLVNALLDFSRIEAGRIQVSYEPLDLAAFTIELASLFRAAIEKAGLKLIVDCPPLDQAVYVDRAMWEKIVLNLLSNAFKFTFAGEIEIALRGVGPCVELSVADTGTGIAGHELSRVFERFHRIEGARGRTFEGSGIGLALVSELARLHRGSVSVDSVFGRGSRFTVTVPLGQGHLPADRVSEVASTPAVTAGASAYVEEATRWLPDDEEALEDDHAEETRTGAAPPRIVLADDNADMRQYLRRLLRGSYDVHTVGDGEAALAAVRENPPDLVVTDIMMPRLDGFGLLKALRADPRTHAIPVIMLSARAGEEARVEGLAAGAHDYLVKPFSAPELLARIGNQITMKRARDILQRELATQNDDIGQLTEQLVASRQNLQREIVERHEADDERTRLAALVENSSDFIGLASPEGLARFVNAGGRKMVGLDRNQTVDGWPILEFIADADREPFVRVAMPALAASGSWEGEIRFKNFGTGAPLPVWQHIFCIREPDSGRPVALATISRDISERRQADDARARLRKAHEELAHAARVMTMGQLTASLAHELNQPLGAVIAGGGAGLRWLASTPPNVFEADASFQRIVRDARRAAMVVARIRAMTRPAEPSKTALRVDEIIQEVLDLVEAEARARGVTVRAAVNSDLPTVAGDRVQLQQVILNLALNAIDAMAVRGDRPPVLALEADRGSAQHVRLAVRDTGPGLPEQDRDRIFDAFYTTKPHGMGMGLAISRRIVEAHGGRLWAGANPGGGALFQFTIPAASSAAGAAGPAR
jgi:PAS domain S-box-containing protein